MSTKGRENNRSEEKDNKTQSSTKSNSNNSKSSNLNDEKKSSKSSTSAAYKHTIGGQLKLKGVVLKTTGKKKREWTPVKVAAEEVRAKTHEELLDERVKQKHDKFC
jgi:hypothetical protein